MEGDFWGRGFFWKGIFFGSKSGVNLKQIFRSLAREGKSEINCSLAGLAKGWNTDGHG